MIHQCLINQSPNLAIAFNLYSPWAAVLAWWALADIRRGEAWFMERVTRAANPFVFWLLMASWLGLCVLMIGLDVMSLKEL